MSLQPLWERFCTSTLRLKDAGISAWCEILEQGEAQSRERLPDALALEDRVLLNAAPVDVSAVLTVHTQTGQFAGAPASGVSAAEPPSGGHAGSSLDMPHGSAADADASSLIAPDLYISVNPEDRIIASYDLGGTNNPHARNIGMAIDRTGWEVFIDNHLEPLLDAGVSRIELHTPFGQRSLIVDPVTGEVTRPVGQWGFQFDAYLDAQVEVPKVTEDFVSAFQDFFARHEGDGQLQDVIPYIGSPRLDGDQLQLINNPQAWWDRAYDVLTPLLEAGFRSIGFDASGTATPDTLDYDLHNVLRYPELRDPIRDARLIDLVGNERVEVYLEAMPTKSSGRTDFPVLVLDFDHEHQDPERPGTHLAFRQQNFYEHDRLTGEIIRLVRHEQWKAEGYKPVERILLDGDIAAVTPTYFLRPKLGGAETLADYIAKMDLPSLPTDVDLDPDDLNPQSAVYTITDGPDHGTLTANRFHGDVFRYVPDPYFTGVDSFEYVVRDASGATSTAVVTFFVNTPVDDSLEGAGPVEVPVTPTLPPAGPASGPSPTQPNPAGPAPVDNPLPPPPVGGPHDGGTGGTTDPDAGGNETGGHPPALPVPTSPPPVPAAPSPPEVPTNVPAPPGEQGGSVPGNIPPPAAPSSPDASSPPPDGSSETPTGPSTPPVDPVGEITDGLPTNPDGVPLVISPETAVVLNLPDDPEEFGIFAGAISVELLDVPQGPTVRVHYGFGVLQFLVSSMYQWLPPQN